MNKVLLACSPGIDLRHFDEHHVLAAIDSRLLSPGLRPTPGARWWYGGALKQYFIVPNRDFTVGAR